MDSHYFDKLYKTIDKVVRHKLWAILAKRGFPEWIVEVIKSLYRGTSILIVNDDEVTKQFIIKRSTAQMQFNSTLFNLYLDNIIILYEANVAKGILLHRHRMVNMLLFTDDQMIIVSSEDRLQ